MPHTILHFASAMEKNPEHFIDKTGGKILNDYGIVHLYQTDDGWKPTKGTESHQPGKELWWGVLLQSNEEPYISDLRRYRFSGDWELVLEDLGCSPEDLKKYYIDSELERMEFLTKME